MSEFAGRLIVHAGETDLEPYTRDFVTGDTVEVIRGSGPREGEKMGTATVTGFEKDGSPVLDVDLGRLGQESAAETEAE